MRRNAMRTLLLLLFSSIALNSTYAARFSAAKSGERFYTQFSFFQEGNQHIATNYRRGTLVPINTLVEFVKASRTKLTMRIVSSDQRLTIANVQKYSGHKIDGIFKRTFGKEKVSLDGFTEREQRNIRNGTIAIGMSKKAVLQAIGFPPSHRTPSLDASFWTYWRHRLGTYVVSFNEDKVAKVEPPHHLDTTP